MKQMLAKTERLYADVDFLTSLRPYRTYKQLETLDACCEYFKKIFGSLDLAVSEQKWEARGNTYTNIIAKYNPNKKRKLIIGAHYDVCGNQPGADDNASAVAGLLETARILSEYAPRLDYCVEFVAYCLEEPPFFATKKMGSYIHAQSLFEQRADVIGMICYEMIGYFSDEPNSQTFPSEELATLYPSTANFIIVVGCDEYQAFSNYTHKLMSKDSGIDVQLINFPDNSALAGLSDHRNYWSFDYPALMINDTSFIRNPNYHEDTDTIDTLDFGKMAEVVNSTYKAVINMASYK